MNVRAGSIRPGWRKALSSCRGLVEFWDKFGAALDYDLLERGIDIRDCFGPIEFRTRNYKTALAMDRDLAEYWLDLEESDESPDDVEEAPTPEGYTLDTYLLLSIIDGLQGVQAAVIAAAGADPPEVKPMPAPRRPWT